MLILARRPGETILIGPDIRVTFLRQDGAQAKIGIDAPQHVAIVREEIAHIPHPQRPHATESVAEYLADAGADPDCDDDSDDDVDPACDRCGEVCCGCYVDEAAAHDAKECPNV